MIKELAEYIEDELGLVVGSDVIIGSLTEFDTTDRAVALRESGGGALDFDLDDQRDQPFDMICRGSNRSEARDLAYMLFEQFHRRDAFDLPVLTSGENYHIIYSMANGLPFDSGQDERGRHYYTLSVTLRAHKY